jgi:hypothetical protein
MQDYHKALHWITDILEQQAIPYQIAGGLAAISYGASRPLYDIDLDTPETAFPQLATILKEYIIFGPEHYQDEHWDLLLMTINYHGQLIDLGGAYETKVFAAQDQRWHPLPVDFNKVEYKTISDRTFPVIPLKDLIHYKKQLGRPVDLQDLAELTETLC